MVTDFMGVVKNVGEVHKVGDKQIPKRSVKLQDETGCIDLVLWKLQVFIQKAFVFKIIQHLQSLIHAIISRQRDGHLPAMPSFLQRV